MKQPQSTKLFRKSVTESSLSESWALDSPFAFEGINVKKTLLCQEGESPKLVHFLLFTVLHFYPIALELMKPGTRHVAHILRRHLFKTTDFEARSRRRPLTI